MREQAGPGRAGVCSVPGLLVEWKRCQQRRCVEPTKIGLCVGLITFQFVRCPGENQNKNQGSPEELGGSGAERAGSPGLGRGRLQMFRRPALDGPGASRDSSDLEAKEEGASLDWRNPIYGWERRTRLQWRLQMRKQKSRKPGKHPRN